MKEWLKKRILRLFASLYSPVWNGLLRAPWWARLLVLMLMLSGLAYVSFPAETKSRLELSYFAFKALIESKSERIPLTKVQRIRLAAFIDSFKSDLKLDLKKAPSSPFYNAWSIGQLLCASGSTNGCDLQGLCNKAGLVSTGGGFSEYAPANLPEVHVTAWYVFGMARACGVVNPTNVLMLLDAQDNGGWWSIYQVEHHAVAYSSTFATALSLLALSEVKTRNCVSNELLLRTEAALNNGVAFLMKTRTPKIGWFDYPYQEHERTEFSSTSAQALHSLHVASRSHKELLIPCDRQWLRSLPTAPKPVSFKEVSAICISAKGDNQGRDTVRHYSLPWSIMATADAYPSGSLVEKARALRWLDRMFDDLPSYDSDIGDLYWVKAELTIALEYLIEHSS